MFNILSLDGGGSWAIIQVKTLLTLYGDKAKGSDVLKNFDLVVANSGGSIVAAALFLDMPLEQIFDLFNKEDERRKVFVSRFFAPVTRRLEVGPRYSTEGKLKGLEGVFGPKKDFTLEQAAADINAINKKDRRTELVVIAYQYDRDRAKFFRSHAASAASGSSATGGVRLAEAVHASSNAPINYFDEPAKVHLPAGSRRIVQFWDGAIAGFNNPALAGVIEAMSGGQPAEEIRILSLGTANVFLPLPKQGDGSPEYLVASPRKSGPLTDVTKLAGAILGDPPDSASFMAHVVLGGAVTNQPDNDPNKVRIVRMNPLIQPVLAADGRWALPPGLTEDEFKALVEMDMDATDQTDVDLIVKLATQWMEGHIPNQPVRAGERLECQIGQRWFLEGWDLAAEHFGAQRPPAPPERKVA